MGRIAPVFVCAAYKVSQVLPFFFLFLCEGRAALYSKLPRAVWTSVHAPQANYGDGGSPYEVSHVHARAVHAVRCQQPLRCGRAVIVGGFSACGQAARADCVNCLAV